MENPDEFKFCSRCGKEIIKPLPLGDPKLKMQRDIVRKVISQRNSTDMIISPIWIVALVALVIVMALVSLGLIFAAAFDMVRDYPGSDPPYSVFIDRAMPAVLVLSIQNIIYGASLSLLTYLLVTRLRNHIKRENLLRTHMSELLANAGGSDARQKMIEERHSGIFDQETIPWQLQYSIIWALIPLVPVLATILQLWYLDTHTIAQQSDLTDVTFVSYLPAILFIALEAYVFYFLGKTVSDHDSSWSIFAQDSRSAMNDLGFPHGRSFNVSTMERRSFLVYFVLSVITLGLWTYYWWYTLVKDPNTHFTKQHDFEDNILDALDKSEGTLPSVTR